MAEPHEMYQCQTANCGYIYNPDKGDRKGKIQKGTQFKDLPDDWKCPICGCEKFYVKDPDDEYETYEFECPDGEICFDPDVDESVAPVVEKETETYCNKCVWHDKFEKLQKQKG